MVRRLKWLLLVAAVAGAGTVIAADTSVVRHGAAFSGAVADSSASRAAFDQKQILLDGLLLSSARRISDHGTPAARALLAKARAGLDASVRAAKAGNLVRANALLDEAMRNLGEAARRNPNQAEHSEQQRLRYSELLKSVEAMVESYERSLGKAGSGDKINIGEMRAAADRARALAQSGRYVEAGDLLENTQGRLVPRINREMGTKPVVYGLKFDSPQKEYEYALTRYRSFEGMIPAVLAQVKQDVAKRERINIEVDAGRRIRAEAEKNAAMQAYEAANSMMQRAIEHFEKAFEISGLMSSSESPRMSE